MTPGGWSDRYRPIIGAPQLMMLPHALRAIVVSIASCIDCGALIHQDSTGTHDRWHDFGVGR